MQIERIYKRIGGRIFNEEKGGHIESAVDELNKLYEKHEIYKKCQKVYGDCKDGSFEQCLVSWGYYKDE